MSVRLCACLLLTAVRAAWQGDIGNQLVGSQARLMSQALRKLASSASKARCTIIFINQIRFKIGVIYGSPEVTSGGQALKFFASLRLEIRNTGRIKGVPEAGRGEVDVGIRTRIRVTKSKVRAGGPSAVRHTRAVPGLSPG